MTEEAEPCYFCKRVHRGDCLVTVLKARIVKLLAKLNKKKPPPGIVS